MLETFEAPVSDEPWTHYFIDSSHTFDHLVQLERIANFDSFCFGPGFMLLEQIQRTFDLLFVHESHLIDCDCCQNQISVLVHISLVKNMREIFNFGKLIFWIFQNPANL